MLIEGLAVHNGLLSKKVTALNVVEPNPPSVDREINTLEATFKQKT